MHISRLVVSNFRNFESQALHPTPGLNWIIGSNGSGKTALLESMYFLSTGRSHRSPLVARLIQHGADALSVFAELSGEGVHHSVGMSRDRAGVGKIKLDHKPQANHLDVAKRLPVLMLDPEGFGLFTEGSKGRRSLLDFGVFHAEPEFYPAWSAVKRILAQRNAGLKGGSPGDVLALFDAQLVAQAERLDGYRSAYVQALNAVLTTLIGDFLHLHDVSVSYFRGWARDEALSDLLCAHVEQDRLHGFTSHGPHRADLRFRVGRTPVQDVLSRGEQKLLICAVKIAQGMLFQQQTGRTPIYLVDDLASELDERHQAVLRQHLTQLDAQVFMTAIARRPWMDNVLVELVAEGIC